MGFAFINMEIDKKIVEATLLCKNNVECLTKTDHCCCKIDYHINDSLFFVKSTSHPFCKHKNFFGNSFMCNCATRQEIYKKFKI